jgi:hypothetical protein
MAYSLNADGGSTKIVLSSTGTYYGPKYKPTFSLSKPILQDERVSSLLSVETVVMKHPSIVDHLYLNGTLTYGNNTETVKGSDFELVTNPSVYFDASDNVLAIDTTHKVLFALLKLLRSKAATNVQQQGINIRWFDDENGQTFYTNLTAANTVLDMAYLDEALRACIFRRDISCQLLSSQVAISMTGDFVQLFGLDPTKTHTVSPNNPLTIRIPMHGHDYVVLSSNLVFGAVSTMNGDSLAGSDFLCVVPTPHNPGFMEYFNNPSIGGKVELGNSTLDSITLEFSDRYGQPLYSLEDFVVTLIIDHYIPAELPKEDHVRLDRIRKATMEVTRFELSKKLRN